MRRVLSVTEPGHPKGALVTGTIDASPLGWTSWALLAGLMAVLSQDSLRPWHIPAILAFWPLAALGWIARQRLGDRLAARGVRR